MWILRFDNWAIWNTQPWQDTGWTNVIVTVIKGKIGENADRFNMGYNGERFADNHGMKRMAKLYPGEADRLLVFLKVNCPKP